MSELVRQNNLLIVMAVTRVDKVCLVKQAGYSMSDRDAINCFWLSGRRSACRLDRHCTGFEFLDGGDARANCTLIESMINGGCMYII